jgi:hypothetical protein
MQCTRCGFVTPPGPQPPVCSQCGAAFDLGADPAMRAILPVGRTPLSIIAGYLGLFSVLCLPAPLALGIGVWAVIDLRKKPGMHGMGRAVFGIVMGAIGTIALIISLIGAIVH